MGGALSLGFLGVSHNVLGGCRGSGCMPLLGGGAPRQIDTFLMILALPSPLRSVAASFSRAVRMQVLLCNSEPSAKAYTKYTSPTRKNSNTSRSRRKP